MRILFIAPFGTCHKQTMLRRMLPLAKGLAGSGHTVEMLIPPWDCPQEAGQVEQMGGLTLRYLELGPAPHHLLDLALVRRMVAAVNAFRPDIVHAFKPFGYSGVVASLLKRQGRPVVVDVDDLETAAGWGQHRWWGLRQLVGVQEKRVLRQTDGVSAASVSLVEECAFIRSGRSGAPLYLPNGLDLASEPAPVASNPPIVLLYTRGNDVSVDRVRKLWSHIVQRAPEASLHIVGDWRVAPPFPHCDYLGWLEGEALVAALRAVALALFPINDSALVRAKSPGRLLDCLAQGLPIVTEDIGEYGLLAGSRATLSVGDDAGIVDATVNLLFDRQLRREHSGFSWRQAGQHAWERRVGVLVNWYEQVLSPFVQSGGRG